jgi:hypothetical protein
MSPLEMQVTLIYAVGRGRTSEEVSGRGSNLGKAYKVGRGKHQEDYRDSHKGSLLYSSPVSPNSKSLFLSRSPET